jgi:predicted nucleotidyltransferase
MMQDYINHRLDKIKEICKNYRVKAAYVFGSVLTDKFSDKSDIDLVWILKEMIFTVLLISSWILKPILKVCSKGG